MNNRDLTYFICTLLIFTSAFISQKSEFPVYSNNVYFDIIILLIALIISNNNIYIGIFIIYNFLLIKINMNK